MKFWRFTSVVILLCVIISGCNSIPAQTSVSLGRQFILPLGKTVSVPEENLLIKFVSVEADSRCPKDVVCIQAGEARCAMQVTHDGLTSDLTFVDKGGINGSSTASKDEFIFSFTLLPYPESTQPAASRKYQLTMTITK